MSDTNNLIKNVAIDNVGLLNNPYIAVNNKFYNHVPMCITIFGVGVSIFVAVKYL